MGKELIISKDPKSPIAEIFRTLRTNIQFMTSLNTIFGMEKRPRTIKLFIWSK